MNSGKYKITAEFTKEVYQNELKNSDLEYNAIKHQPYFEFEVYGKSFLLDLIKYWNALLSPKKQRKSPNQAMHSGQLLQKSSISIIMIMT